MRTILAAFLFLALSSGRVAAEDTPVEIKTPEQMVTLYFDAFKQGNFEVIADNMHEQELIKFKAAILPAIEKSREQDPIGAGRDAAALRSFLGIDSVDVVKAESPRDFLVRFMKWMAKLNPMMMTGMAGATMETLGSVPEKDMVHIVCRVNVDMLGVNFSQLKVMSVKKQGDEWKLMLTGEIDGMAKVLEGQSTRKSP